MNDYVNKTSNTGLQSFEQYIKAQRATPKQTEGFENLTEKLSEKTIGLS